MELKGIFKHLGILLSFKKFCPVLPKLEETNMFCMSMSRRTLSMFLVLITLMLFDHCAFASTSGVSSVLPYEAWLVMFQKSLTGPVAFSIALIGIVISGASLILMGGEMSAFVRSVIYIILVMTLLIGANSLMTNFFNGASIGLI